MRFPNRLYPQLFVLVALLSSSLSGVAADQYPKHPLNERIVVALIAGASLPESVATDIADCGLTFQPSQQYLSRLTQIGADPIVINALKQAKMTTTASNSHPDDNTVLEHLFLTGEKMKAKKFIDAAKELISATDSPEEHPELVFVMGQIMREEEAFGQAAALYSKLAEIDSEFPEVHTKLSLVLYKDDDAERGALEARAALARTPNNAEAHQYMGLNLEVMKQFDAAIAEYQKALALKPDYPLIHLDLGILYADRGDYRNAIAEDRKTIALIPDNAWVHHNLSLALRNTNELGTAINEVREAIRLLPNEIDWRIELANLMADAGDRDGGVEEFRKIIRMSPDSSYCHRCFGFLLLKADRLDEAVTEFHLAIQSDKADAESHYGLGQIFVRKHQQDDALKEFLESARLGKDSWGIHLELSKIYLARKQNDEALTEIKQSLSQVPTNGYLHEELADILVASGKNDDAIQEYGQASQLLGGGGIDKEASDIERKVAAVYEKVGSYAMALRAYRGMFESFPNYQTKAEYESARTRLSAHLPASALQGDAMDGDPQALVARQMEKSREMGQAIAERRWSDAERAGKEAIALAEQMQPQDFRLVGAMDTLAQSYHMQKRDDEAERLYLKALAVSEKVMGATDLQTMFAMYAVGHFYLDVKNYSQAVEYLTRSFDLSQKLYGGTYGYETLDLVGQAYAEQRKFDQAEDAFKRTLTAYETKEGPSSPSSAKTLEHLGVLYCDIGKFADAQSALERALAIDQKQFGATSPSLDRPMNELARALRGLGKDEEAKALDHRRELLAQNQPH
jgi:tetratricopeptide (TPR) repeat protein